MARKNVIDVWNAWLKHQSRSVGPVATDGETITSYGMPLLTRQGSRLFVAKRGKSLYSMTTTQHLSGLHELLLMWPDKPLEALEVDARDVEIAARGGDDADMVVIKYVDVPSGRIGKGNPSVTPEQAEQQFRELVTDPDPAAMLVAEDVVVQNHLSLSALGERWEDETPVAGIRDGAAVNTFSFFSHSWRSTLGLFKLGTHTGFVRWAIYEIGRRGYEWEITVGDQRLPDGRTTFAHVSYVKGQAAARREAAADAWVIAKAVKVYGGGRDMPEQYLIDALFLPDATPPEVFGGKRMLRKWGHFDVPSEEALDKLSEYMKRARPAVQTVLGAEIARSRKKKNPPKGSSPPIDSAGATPELGEYIVTTANRQYITSARSVRDAREVHLRRWPDDPDVRVVRINPGELASVERQYENLIRKGMARTIWAYAYGVWAQEDMGERDPDAIEFFTLPAPELRTSPIGFTIGTWIGEAPPTPIAAKHAAQDLSNAIGNSEEVASSETPMAMLFALAMEIDTGEVFEFVDPTPTPAKRPDTVLLFDEGSNHPRRFADEMVREAVEGVSEAEWETLAQGEEGDDSDNYGYWDTWSDVEQNAVITDPKTKVKYTLAYNDNGVLFLIPEGMEWSDEDEWYVWPTEDSDVHVAEEFGQCLAHMALRDGNSWFDDHKQTSGTMEWKPEIAQFTVTFDFDQLTWLSPHMEGPKNEYTERRIRISFESVTPGEEDGDEPEVENGWEDEEGVLVEEDDDEDIVAATVKFLCGGNNRYGGGACGLEPSSSTFWGGGNVWYTQIDGSTNYQTGEERRLSYHLHGYTLEEEKAIFDAIKERR